MSSLMEIISFTCIILILNLVVTNANEMADEMSGPKESRSHSALRRLDCQFFCKKTGFSGIVGGCQCGFTLFSSKRSETNSNDNIGWVFIKFFQNEASGQTISQFLSKYFADFDNSYDFLKFFIFSNLL